MLQCNWRQLTSTEGETKMRIMCRLIYYQNNSESLNSQGEAWHGMAWHDMTWHGVAWQDMAWHGMTHSTFEATQKCYITKEIKLESVLSKGQVSIFGFSHPHSSPKCFLFKVLKESGYRISQQWIEFPWTMLILKWQTSPFIIHHIKCAIGYAGCRIEG